MPFQSIIAANIDYFSHPKDKHDITCDKKINDWKKEKKVNINIMVGPNNEIQGRRYGEGYNGEMNQREEG